MATATPSLAAVEWTPVSLPDAVGSWEASGVVASDDGFVIYGTINQQAAVWTSTDASDWASLALPGVEGAPMQGAVSADALVLAGAGGTGRCAHPFGEFIWHRQNGDATWNAAPFNEELFCAGGAPLLAATNDGFMIAGTGSGEQPFAWVSNDGLAWRDASAGLTFDAPPWLLSATGDGFIALGRGGITDARLWTSAAGWTKVLAPRVAPAFNDGRPGISPAALLSIGHGTLAVYQSDDGSMLTAWRRQDDGSWAEVAVDGLESGGGVVGAPPLAAGTADERAVLFTVRAQRAGVLTSTDLTGWSALPIPQLNRVVGLAELDHRLVLVGTRSTPDGSEQTFVFSATTPPR